MRFEAGSKPTTPTGAKTPADGRWKADVARKYVEYVSKFSHKIMRK